MCTRPGKQVCPTALSICGRAEDPDRVGVLVDVTHPHSAPQLTLGFGTWGMHLVDPCDASYGLQAVSVFVR